MQLQSRKYKNNLVISGGAIILFQIWALAKVVLSTFIGSSTTGGVSIKDMVQDPSLYSEYQETVDTFSSFSVLTLLLVFLIIVVLFVLDIIFRIYVGRSAIRIGKGLMPSNNRYIVLAIFLLIISLAGDVLSVIQLTRSPFDIVGVMAFIVELTSVYALADLIRSARKVDKYSRSLSE